MENSKVIDSVDVEWADKFMESESDKFDLVFLHDLMLIVSVVHNCTSGVRHSLYKIV